MQIELNDYGCLMSRRNPVILRAVLLLIVALGPLQAQIVFACAMADMVVHDDCCCENHDAAAACTNSGCDPALESGTPCCERSVEIGIDQDSRPGAAALKHAETRFGADLPPALLSSSQGFLPSEPLPIPATFARLAVTGGSASDTWLITRRLRI